MKNIFSRLQLAVRAEEGAGEGRPAAGDRDGEGGHPDPPLQPAQHQQQEVDFSGDEI